MERSSTQMDQFHTVVIRVLEEAFVKVKRGRFPIVRSLLALSTIGLAVSGCTTQRKEVYSPLFSTHPYGKVSLKEAKPQPGNRSLPKPTSETFREITIAQGSGLAGFDSIRIFSNGTGYAVVGHQAEKGTRVPVRLSPEQIALLLRAIHRDRLHQ